MDAKVRQLAEAAYAGNVSIVRMLLDGPAPRPHVDSKFEVFRGQRGYLTPLGYAAWKGHVEVVESLLARGADPTVRNDGGWTALNLANTAEISQLLVVSGVEWAECHRPLLGVTTTTMLLLLLLLLLMMMMMMMMMTMMMMMMLMLMLMMMMMMILVVTTISNCSMIRRRCSVRRPSGVTWVV
jgi:hypothetical protein